MLHKLSISKNFLRLNYKASKIIKNCVVAPPPNFRDDQKSIFISHFALHRVEMKGHGSERIFELVLIPIKAHRCEIIKSSKSKFFLTSFFLSFFLHPQRSNWNLFYLLLILLCIVMCVCMNKNGERSENRIFLLFILP